MNDSFFSDFSSDDFDQEKNGHFYPSYGEEQQDENFLLSDEEDHEILMHRDAHFGGSFKIMMDYYLDEDHIGINPEFEIERIAYLAEVEKQLGRDLAPLFLTEIETEKVRRAQEAYQQLKELYSIEKETSSHPRLIADLILSEEEDPETEMEAVVNQGKVIVPLLIQILRSDEAYDALFPGYGYAPYLSAQCLGRIGEASAIIPLFEMLNRETVFEEDIVLESLREIGEEAQNFLIKQLKSRPLTQDNVHAAYALILFSDNEKVSRICLEQLKDPQVQVKPLLSRYLLLNCASILETEQWKEFEEFSRNPQLPAELKKEISQFVKEFKS